METCAKKMEHVSNKSVQLARIYKVLRFRNFPNFYKVSSFQPYFSAESMISLVKWRLFGHLPISLKDSLLELDQKQVFIELFSKRQKQEILAQNLAAIPAFFKSQPSQFSSRAFLSVVCVKDFICI